MDSSSSEDDFIPVGMSMLNIKSKAPTILVNQKQTDNGNAFPPELQYYNLLTRAMDILNKSKDTENERIKLNLSVVRKNKKTMLNVEEIAKQLKRQTEHLSQFIIRMLQTDGSINKEGFLVLRGTFLQSAIEKVIKQFIEVYVACKTCDSVEDTYITRENKLFFLRCSKCNGSRCVGNAIEGFTYRKDESTIKLRGML